MVLLTSFALLLLTAYVVGVSVHNRKVPCSVTETASYLSWPWRTLFYVCVGGSVLLAAPAVIDATDATFQFLAFITLGAALMCVISTYGRDSIENILLVIGTIVFYVAAAFMLAFSSRWWLVFLPLGMFIYVVVVHHSHSRLMMTAATVLSMFLYAIL